MSSISLIQPDRDLFSWPQYWAACFGPAPFLPMSREEMDQLGWDSCDIILVTGDAYVQTGAVKTTLCVWVNRICFSVLLLATWTR